jgi:hypothetical protein
MDKRTAAALKKTVGSKRFDSTHRQKHEEEALSK